jgi:hypothetical protein
MRPLLALLSLCAALAVAVACGDDKPSAADASVMDAASADQVCDRHCARRSTCGLLEGTETLASCTAACKADGASCWTLLEPCTTCVEAAMCSALMSGQACVTECTAWKDAC